MGQVAKIKLATLKRKAQLEVRPFRRYTVRKSLSDGEVVVFPKGEFISQTIISLLSKIAVSEGFQYAVALRQDPVFKKEKYKVAFIMF